MDKSKIAVIGLGYVGLPLARLFASKYSVVAYDINLKRVDELKSGIDSTLEVDDSYLQTALKNRNDNTIGLFFSNKSSDLIDSDIYIITVPTPVDKNNRPILSYLYKASEQVGKVLKKDNLVIYESTVYPGATEEECIPILEKKSGLKIVRDFYVGYSPERVNPGDKKHTVENILKVTSGYTIEIGKKVDKLYKSVITAGTYLAPSIKVAEAAKVIENAQRDINIAFVNELSKIFNLLEIDTHDVLKAAGTKWNFLKFKPGLVGGHCIGVDPYYIAQKAQELGYHPEIILSGRRINDGMGQYVASKVIKLMLKRDIQIKDAEILILGITFKENCTDLRNTKAIDVVNHLQSYNTRITIYDPWVKSHDLELEYGISCIDLMPFKNFYDAVVLTVAHREFLELDIKSYLKNKKAVIYDVKGVLNKEDVDGRI